MSTTYEDILDISIGTWDNDEEQKIAEHLELLGDVDLEAPCYSFNLLRVYRRKSDRAYLYAFDSGCSCPSPFDYVKVSDLKESSTIAAVADAAAARLDKEYGDRSEADVRKDVRNLGDR